MIVKCSECNNEIKRSSKSEKYYCNHKCYSLAKKKQFAGDSNPRWNGGTLKLKCLICSKDFTSKKYGIGREPKFCSHECYSQWRSENITGNNHPNFRGLTGGKITRPVRWLKKYKLWMQKIIARDNKQCRNCLSNERLEVHHIEPLAKLVTDYIHTHGKLNGNDDFFYDESNGITLCRKCHIIVHKTKSGELLEPQTNS